MSSAHAWGVGHLRLAMTIVDSLGRRPTAPTQANPHSAARQARTAQRRYDPAELTPIQRPCATAQVYWLAPPLPAVSRSAGQPAPCLSKALGCALVQVRVWVRAYVMRAPARPRGTVRRTDQQPALSRAQHGMRASWIWLAAAGPAWGRGLAVAEAQAWAQCQPGGQGWAQAHARSQHQAQNDARGRAQQRWREQKQRQHLSPQGQARSPASQPAGRAALEREAGTCC